MPMISLNNVEMYYEISGKGPPLILLGGLANDHTIWDPFLPILSADFTTITIDNRGSGQTVYPSVSFSVHDMASDVIDLLHHLKIEKAYLIGFSLGGSIAEVVASQSAIIEKVILIATATEFSLINKLTGRFQLMLRKNLQDRSMLSLGLLPWLFSSQFLSQPDIVEKIAEKLYGNMDSKTLVGYEHQLEALEGYQGEKEVSKIHQPCLVLGGDEDLLILPKHVQQLHKLLPNSKLHMISNAAHMVIYEQPKEVFEQILTFFK